MKLLLDRTNYFNFSTDFLYVKIFALGRYVSSCFCHAKTKLPCKHWTLNFIENSAFTILLCWVVRVPLSGLVHHQLLHVSFCVYNM